ncbi:hypothetical protein GCM10010211_85400 [Streptomyces albospinus]|uniref:Kinase n=1 Tax=Streptomyces albospinus TaxID=285515 RepID=A0ABQ2VPE3_9ACTN|nr:hypothetical protein GCM10010211_85400 [Streptomyces albospinus]
MQHRPSARCPVSADLWVTEHLAPLPEPIRADVREPDPPAQPLLSLALEALRFGTNVVLVFGCWSSDERFAIRWLVESVGASCDLVYVPVDLETQCARIAHRQSTTPDQTFPMSEADLVHWRTLFQELNAAQLGGHEIGSPPPGWQGWPEWAADRWPSFT